LVQDFILVNESKNNEELKVDKIKVQDEPNHIKINEINDNININININNDDLIEYEKTIKCQHLAQTLLSQKTEKLIITIDCPEKIRGGLFGSDYLTYGIKTNPLGWSVRRKWEHIDWLKKILIGFFPG